MINDNDKVNPDETEPIVEVEFDGDVVEGGDVSILNSLVSHGNPRSLQLMGKIKNSAIKVFIDSGRTHNFI